MKSQPSLPFSLNSGNIKKDIKAIKNWVDADLKYQIWSLNTKASVKATEKTPPSIIDKKEITPPIKKTAQ